MSETNDILTEIEQATTDLHLYAFHHGAFQPPSRGRLNIPYHHTPTQRGRDHKAAREAHEAAMDNLRASVARLREVASAAGAMWAEHIGDIAPDEMSPEQRDFIAAMGRLEQQDVGDTARIGPVGAAQ